jgi:hypothetical protein
MQSTPPQARVVSATRLLSLVFFLSAFSYGALLIVFGFQAASQAPPEANATTAIMIPAVCAAVLCVVGAVGLFASGAIRKPVPAQQSDAVSEKPAPSPRLARVAQYAVVVLPFIFALLFFMPYRARSAQLENFPQARQQFDAAVAEGKQFPTRDDRRAFFRERSSPDHDTTYLVQVLKLLIFVSLFFGVSGIVFSVKLAQARKLDASRGLR